MSVDKIESIAILGTNHKRFGYNEPLEYDGGVYYDVFNGSDKRIVKCAVPIKRYTFNLIAKCVTYYLTHPKMIGKQRAATARYGCMCLPPRGATGLRLKTQDI